MAASKFGYNWGLPSQTTANLGPIGWQSFKDGQSSTAMISEMLIGLPWESSMTVSPISSDAKRVLWPLSGVNIVLDAGDIRATQAFVDACRSIPSVALLSVSYPNIGWQGSSWAGSELVNMDAGYNHVNTPNALSCSPANNTGNCPGCPGYNNALTAASYHLGGINVCFADGSVHFVRDQVATKTWWALGTRNGEEVLSQDNY
jgi:prepilin-type processing-associated H-X9-DG protein